MRVAVSGLGSYVAQVGVIPALRRSSWTEFVGGTTTSTEVARRVLLDNERRYPDYEAILGDPSVDAVYLPLPNDLHLDYLAKALVADKHVLCEKPILASEAEYEELERLVATSSCLVAEAFMSSYHPRLRSVLAHVASGALGEIVSIQTTFTGTLSPLGGYRLDPTRGGGSLFDVGIYALHPIVTLLGDDPTSISTAVMPSATNPPVDLTMNCLLSYPQGISAAFITSFVSAESQNVRILTRQATVEVNRACTPSVDDTTWTVTTTAGTTTHESRGCDPYQAMVDEVFEAFTDGREPSWNLTRAQQLAVLLFRISEVWRNDDQESERLYRS
jgi:xylose dehydrogenase (NAD/NADP)